MLGLLTGLLFFPITGPLYGLRFITEQIRAELDAELLDEGRLEKALMVLSVRHDLGELSAAEYAAEEAALLQELNAIRAYKQSLLQPDDSVEAEPDDDDEYEDDDGEEFAYAFGYVDDDEYEYYDTLESDDVQDAVAGESW